MGALGAIIYFGLGLLQLAAIMAGLGDWLGLHWIIAGPLALFLAYLPLVGSILGLLGAVHVWDWAWWQAGLLFFGGFAVTIAFGGLSAMVDSFRSRRSA
jgi:hypothetical protein